MHSIKKIIFLLIFLLGYGLQAQHTIYGSFSPPKEYKWVIAYHLNSGSPKFIANTKMQNGNFMLNIPTDAPTGTYRLVYGGPQDKLYLDLIYNGKEDVQLNFDSIQGATFLSSKENIPYKNYFSEINKTQQEIISCYEEGVTDESTYVLLNEKLKNIQQSYEEKTKGLIAHHFIKANSPYVSAKYETAKEYIQHTKDSYFDNINVNDPILQSSRFLMDKIGNYVFTSIPLEATPKETEHTINENLQTVNKELYGVNASYKIRIFHSLWKQATASNMNTISDTILNGYLGPLAKETNQTKVIDDIIFYNRLRIGAIAPEITWEDGNTTKKLSELGAAQNYVIVFWSSTCPHCLKEVPMLHKELMNNTSIKVLAVGLEDNDINWIKESKKLNGFEHALALGKWENKYVGIYGIQQTPTYFILDKNKKIVGKPANYKETIAFFN